MKFILVFIALLLIGISLIAQNDTTKVKVPVQPPPIQPTDSLMLDGDRLILKPISPDYKSLEKDFDIFSEEMKLTFELPKKKQKSILNSPYTKFAVPASLIGLGFAARNTRSLDEMKINFDENGNYSGKKTSVDDYLRYIPYAGIYGFDLVGIKAKHNFRDRTFVLATSFLIMDQTVNLMKNNIPTWRPDGSNQRSFPSSHTSVAFVGAHITFKEYKDSSILAASSGYVFAATTGALRVVNEKHSVADVAAGAGIGILSVEAGYLLLPVFHKIFGIKDSKKNLVITPTYNTESIGVGMAYTF